MRRRNDRRLNWNVPWPYLVAILFGLAVFVLLVRFESFERLYFYSRQHEHWELDEFFTALMVLAGVFMAVLLLRARELRVEIARRQEAEQLARTLAKSDALTGLPNRRYFEEAFDQMLADAGDRPITVLFFNFDGFKAINDNLGHDAGDKALTIMASRCKRLLQPGDLFARMNSNKFIAALAGPTNLDEVEAAVARLFTVVSEPVSLMGRQVTVTLNVGVARYPEDGQLREPLLQKVDVALAQARRNGTQQFVIYDASLNDAKRESRLLEFELGDAFAKGEIVSFYQPIVSYGDRCIGGMETLARWNHPRLGLLPAGDFVSLVEGAGLTNTLFETMLENICRDAVGWPSTVFVAVNVTPHQLRNPAFSKSVLAILARHRFPPSRLEIEITEDALVQDLGTTRKNVVALKSQGVRFALDDFGTGYSSLTQLQQLPFDHLKIDRSFVSGLGKSRQSEEIVRSAINLSHALGMRAIAEGVETDEQEDWLRAHGADAGQGYKYSRAVAARDVPDLFRKKIGL